MEESVSGLHNVRIATLADTCEALNLTRLHIKACFEHNFYLYHSVPSHPHVRSWSLVTTAVRHVFEL